MDKVKQKLLEDFKRSNSERKEKLAKKYGFNTSAEYLAYLNNGPEVSEHDIQEVEVKPTIHNVVLLDATGSMQGSKYNNSIKGIQTELDWLKTQNDVNYTETIVEFIQEGYPGSVKTNKICFIKDPNKVDLNFVGANGNNTPLYAAINDIIELVIPKVKDSDKVLLKIYTDGDNNRLRQYLGYCKQLIKDVQSKNFTVTFVGTKADLGRIIKDLDLDKSNCLEIENTGEGFEKAFEQSFISTQTYAKKVLAKEDVSVGFYKSIVK